MTDFFLNDLSILRVHTLHRDQKERETEPVAISWAKWKLNTTS